MVNKTIHQRSYPNQLCSVFFFRSPHYNFESHPSNPTHLSMPKWGKEMHMHYAMHIVYCFPHKFQITIIITIMWWISTTDRVNHLPASRNLWMECLNERTVLLLYILVNGDRGDKRVYRPSRGQDDIAFLFIYNYNNIVWSTQSVRGPVHRWV